MWSCPITLVSSPCETGLTRESSNPSSTMSKSSSIAVIIATREKEPSIRPLLEFAFDRRASLGDLVRVGLDRPVADVDRESTVVGCGAEFDDRCDAVERLADRLDRLGLD